MLNLTQEERKVILFLITAALVGLGINFFIKINSRIKTIAIADINIAKLDINKAGLNDLLQCNCISSKLAKKIIEYRDTQGPFSNLEDLKEIKGIGDYRYEKLKDLFFVE